MPFPLNRSRALFVIVLDDAGRTRPPADIKMTVLTRRSHDRLARTFIYALIALAPAAAAAQDPDQVAPALALFAGDSVRVNGSVVGRVLSVEGNYFTLLSRGKPVCRAGEMHGDAPICDPAPLNRETLAIDEVILERRAAKGNPTVWALGGLVLGGAAFSAVGYAIGPSVGFGKVDGCTAEETDTYCLNPLTREELDAQQKQRDQKRGALFFGVVGGTFVAILARKFSVGWVELRPTMPVRSEEGWGMSFTVPSN